MAILNGPDAIAPTPQARRLSTPSESAPPSVSIVASALPSLLVSSRQSSACAGWEVTRFTVVDTPRTSVMTAALLPSVPSLIMVTTPLFHRPTGPASKREPGLALAYRLD